MITVITRLPVRLPQYCRSVPRTATMRPLP